MEFNEVVMTRRSVRAFLPDPVPRETITKIVDLARWAPSWGNTQPWEIVVADGEKVRQLADIFQEEAKKAVPPRPDIHMPTEFSGIHKQRYMDLGKDLLSFMGVKRDDKQARIQHYLNMYSFFGAPAVVYICINKDLNEPYSSLDVGSIGTTLCYAATNEGLGTIYLAAAMHYPDLVRKILDIPDSNKVVIGIALGYPHPSAPASVFKSKRDAMDTMFRFA